MVSSSRSSTSSFVSPEVKCLRPRRSTREWSRRRPDVFGVFGDVLRQIFLSVLYGVLYSF